MTTIYRYDGHLVDAINQENVLLAAQYLLQDDMTQYLDDDLKSVVKRISWHLFHDGYTYHVEAICERDLTDEEIEELRSWVSGQNSDGLGEGFEQQDWAWVPGEHECDGPYWSECNCDEENGHMCSFDWETNDSTFVKVS